MSLVQPTGRQPSPGMPPNLNLSSNNPFRNRAVSPASFQSLPSPPQQNIPQQNNQRNFSRPVSNNPFLDAFEDCEPSAPSAQDTTTRGKNPLANPPADHVAELFENLAVSRPPQTASPAPPPVNRPTKPAAFTRAQSTKGENQAPRHRLPPPPGHRPSRSQEEEQRRRVEGRSRAPETLDIFAEPPKSQPHHHRPRRNSDSSAMEKRPLDPEEERKRRERKAREREARHRHKDGKSKRPNQRLDVIDKLDVTSIYGTGLFHHDGPFDACNPHRNRKGSSRAPMQAFPKDSANNTLGGSGPINSRVDLDKINGYREDAFEDYSTRAPSNQLESFDVTMRAEPVHGDESMGLGTSTFLEGAPASQEAIRRRQNDEQQALQGGGLSRKKSLAQRIRGISNNRPQGIRNKDSPEPVEEERDYRTGSSHHQSHSAGGMRKASESNPFYNDYDDAYDRKGAKIEERSTGVARAPSSPHQGSLERRRTGDGREGESRPTGGGLLNRMKSLKGGRRTRPERRE